MIDWLIDEFTIVGAEKCVIVQIRWGGWNWNGLRHGAFKVGPVASVGGDPVEQGIGKEDETVRLEYQNRCWNTLFFWKLLSLSISTDASFSVFECLFIQVKMISSFLSNDDGDNTPWIWAGNVFVGSWTWPVTYIYSKS